jgi:uncharacterized iron-regulated membrane protein
MASRQALRRAWWQVHKWTGLFLMILLIPLGLSGVILAWDDAIDHGLNPQRYAVQGRATLAPSAYAAAASGVLQPDEHITMIRYPDGTGPVVVMASKAPRGKHEGDLRHQGGAAHDAGRARHDGAVRRGSPQRTTLWLDPTSGRLLDQMRGDSGLVRLAHNFHGSLFVPGVGRALVGLLGIAMFLMAAGGVWLWWPTVGRFSSGLRWKRGDRRLDTNLHHTVGFWIALPLAFQAFTGVWIAWPQMMATIGLASAGGGMGERSRMTPSAHPVLTPDRALAAARGAFAGEPSSIGWPTGEDGPWRVALSTAKGQADVTVDDATGNATIAPQRGGVALAIRHLHDGTTLGTGWRVVMVLWGMAPTVLGVTGVIMWWRGRRWRADLARRTARTRDTTVVS